MEDWVTIRNLKKKDPNLGTRTIALMLGISRNIITSSVKNNTINLFFTLLVIIFSTIVFTNLLYLIHKVHL